MTGLGNFYAQLINYPSRMNRWHYYLYLSCIKTLATKHRISTKKVINTYGFQDISISNERKKTATDKRIISTYQVDKKQNMKFS